MKGPDNYVVSLPNGLVISYSVDVIYDRDKGMIVTYTKPRPCGFAMGCVKSDDSTITWDATAMERNGK